MKNINNNAFILQKRLATKRKKIKILSSCCSRGHKASQEIEKMIKSLNVDVNIKIIDDMMKFVKYGVLSTPAIVVDDKVIYSGSIPEKDELEGLINN